MNVPIMSEDDAAFHALKGSEFKISEYSSKAGGSNLDGSKTYDQLAFTEGDIEQRVLDYSILILITACSKENGVN